MRYPPELPGLAFHGLLHLLLIGTLVRLAVAVALSDGGPGGSGIRIARVPGYFEAFEALTAVADVILLDQRGTGKSDSVGLYCRPPEGRTHDMIEKR